MRRVVFLLVCAAAVCALGVSGQPCLTPRANGAQPSTTEPTPAARPIVKASPALQPMVGATAGLPALPLGHPALLSIGVKKATCPFIASAVVGGELKVYGSQSAPLASVDEVTALGNSGGGTLGWVLRLFAVGNHARLPSGGLTPLGFFSLDFPGSQGSHPGHSGILQSDPRRINSGRWSQSNFNRLLAKANSQGLLTRAAVGAFIAENLKLDPNSKVISARLALTLVADVAKTVAKLSVAVAKIAVRGKKASAEEIRAAAIAVTRTAGAQNLIGSAGEFGLLFALLRGSPKTRTVDGATAIHVSDVQAMFQAKRFPSGWVQWKKSATDWVAQTAGLAAAAAKAYIKN